MKVIKARLANYSDRVDGTVSLKLDSLLEVPDSDIAKIRGMRGNIAVAVITNVGDYVKVGKDDSGVTLYCKVLSKECRPSNNEWVVWTGTKFYY